MPEEARVPEGQSRSWPFALPNLIEVMRLPAGQRFQHQVEFLEIMLKNMAAWTKRREELMDATLRAVSTVSTAQEPGLVIAAYDEWLKISFNCIIGDLANVRDETLHLAEFCQKSAAIFLRDNAGGTISPGAAASEGGAQNPQRTRASA